MTGQLELRAQSGAVRERCVMSSYIVHIEGPDDVLYYETEEKATKHAAAFNAYFAEIANPDRPLWPHLRAVVYTHEEWAGRRREILDAP